MKADLFLRGRFGRRSRRVFISVATFGFGNRDVFILIPILGPGTAVPLSPSTPSTGGTGGSFQYDNGGFGSAGRVIPAVTLPAVTVASKNLMLAASVTVEMLSVNF